MVEEIRDATLHGIMLEGQYCVTFRQTYGKNETLSFKCYPTERKALRAISLFKYHGAWKELASV